MTLCLQPKILIFGIWLFSPSFTASFTLVTTLATALRKASLTFSFYRLSSSLSLLFLTSFLSRQLKRPSSTSESSTSLMSLLTPSFSLTSTASLLTSFSLASPMTKSFSSISILFYKG